MAKLSCRNHICEVEAWFLKGMAWIVGQTIMWVSFRILESTLIACVLYRLQFITDLPIFLEALILYLKRKYCINFIHPYLYQSYLVNEELEILEEDKADEVL